MSTVESDEFAQLIDRIGIKGFHHLISMNAAKNGEWAGCPLPIKESPLVIEQRSPYVALNGFCFDENEPIDNDGDDGVEFINHWYTEKTNTEVFIYRENGKLQYLKQQHRVSGHERLDLWLRTLGAAVEVWDWGAELQALKLLKRLITPHAFKCYFLTGMFLETSPRSSVTYLFRRSRPTIALTSRLVEDKVIILSILCLHPIGYYKDTFAGTMVPTDDVIAHLVMMRGDEHLFWRKANHHLPRDRNAGI